MFLLLHYSNEMSTADIVAMNVCQFQKDRDEQARCEFERVLLMNVRIVGHIFASFALSTVGIVEMNVCQFFKGIATSKHGANWNLVSQYSLFSLQPGLFIIRSCEVCE